MRRSLLVALIGVGLLVASCGGDPASTEAVTETQVREARVAARQTLAARTTAMLAAPRPSSPRADVSSPPAGRFAIPSGIMARTPGRVAREYRFEEDPRAMLVANDGSLIIAVRVGEEAPRTSLQVIGPGNELRFPYSVPAPVHALHWNADGTAFVASMPGAAAILPWPPQTDDEEGVTRTAPRARRVVHSPDAATMLLLEDLVDFSATTPNLIAWNVSEQDEAGEIEPLARALPVSSIGSFPQLGILWGHPREEWRLFPDRAPIWELNAAFEPVRQLTRPREDVDLRPQAAADGRLWFIRAPRQIFSATGSMGIAPNARAWTTSRESGAEQMVTAEPTLDVAVSPDGARVAFLVARGDQLVAVVDGAEQVLARDLGAQVAASADYRRRMLAIREGVEAAFLLTPISRGRIQESPVGSLPSVPPDGESVRNLGYALLQQIEEQFGVDLEEGIGKLGVIDGLLAEGDGLWTESPAMVLALAGVYAGALMESEQEPDGVQWVLDLARPDLSYTLDRATFLPGQLVLGPEGSDAPLRIRVGGVAQLHSPFHVARERLAGRLPLDGAAREVLGHRARPILLVENFEAANLSVALVTSAQRVGLDLTGEDMDSFARVAVTEQENTLANLAIYLVASQQRQPELTLTAALNLAETMAWSADSLLLTVEPLFWIGEPELAIRAAEIAARQSPEDPDVLLDVALAYYDDLNFDEAERYLGLAEKADVLNELSLYIGQTRRMIADSRAREAAEEETP